MLSKKLIFLLMSLLLASCNNGSGSDGNNAVTPNSLPEAYQNAQTNFNAPHKAMNDPYQTAWDILLTMAWPASQAGRGLADPSVQPGPNQVAVMSTWKNSTEVYLPNGATPSAWDANSPESQAGIDEILTQEKPLQFNAGQASSAGGVSADLRDTHGNPIYYQVRMNRAAFDAVVGYNLYNTEGLLAFYNANIPNGTDLSAPKDAIEIKMAWKILYPEDDFSRYYTRQAQIAVKGKPMLKATMGLVGMHVMSKIVPNWFFTTFEQVDNIKTTNITKLGVSPIKPSAKLATTNNRMHALFALTNSPWQYYNCMGVEVDGFNDKTGAPSHLGNSQIETEIMPTASCIACHAYAGIGASPIKKKPFIYIPGAGIDPATGFALSLLGTPNPLDTYPDHKYPNMPDPKSAIYVHTDFMWSPAFEGQPMSSTLQVPLGCVKNWSGPTGSKAPCFTLDELDQ